ncbi:MAG: energy-coupling factor transporter ATPase [Mitsuokella sp.]
MSIEIKHISYTYMPKTPFERQALKEVTATIEEGTFTAIAGHTGSGKSTLLQHLNGLLHPTEGHVVVDGVDLLPQKKSEKKAARAARMKVGMVFQYPEQQLFEETVEADIAFGPKNLELSGEDVASRVRESMELVHLDYERFHARSPFALSGGQMRRVAIAGILALRPKYLVLDEPTAGLDPRGRKEILSMVTALHRRKKTTVIFVSHNMDDIARLARHLLVFNKGMLVADGTPQAVFGQTDVLREAGLRQPHVMTLLRHLREAGLPLERTDVLTAEEAEQAICAALKKMRGEKS